jgi:hypothetical protein
MADTKKKLEIGDLPARAKVLDEGEAAEVFGGAALKRGGKRRPPAKKRGKPKGRKPPVKRGRKPRRPPARKRPKLGPVKKRP